MSSETVSTESVWPRSTGFVVGDIPLALRFVARPAQWRPIAAVVLLLGLYFAGLFIPIPGAVSPKPNQQGDWWFIAMLDFLLTGGALRRGCLFSMGLLAPALLGANARGARSPYFLLRYIVGLPAGAMLTVYVLQARGLVGPHPQDFFKMAVWVAFGAVALKMINVRLIRYRAPAPFYLNLSVFLFVSLRQGIQQLLAAQETTAVIIIAVSMVFIAVSAIFVLRSTVYIDVESIRSAFTQSSATLEISAVGEQLLDTIGSLCLIFYLCIGGGLSLVFGWREVTPGNSPVFLAASILVFAFVWSTFSKLVRLRGFQQIVNVPIMFGFADPREYALRMLHNYWIVPGCPAGPDTEQYIAKKLAAATRRSFLLLGSWVGVVLLAQYAVSRAGRSIVLFPYGPLVFVFTVLMLLGNASMILRHLWASLEHFREALRGKSRVLAGTFPLGDANKVNRFRLDADFQQYWEEEKMSEQIREVIDYVRMARLMYGNDEFYDTRRVRFQHQTMKWMSTLLTGVMVAFVACVGCLLLAPGMGRKEIGLIAIPAFLGPLFAPDAMFRVLKRFGGK
jgi:hypothetical protein